MDFDPEKWKFSSKALSLSASDFKDLVKSGYPGTKVKEINELYKRLHGNDLTIEDEAASDSE